MTVQRLINYVFFCIITISLSRNKRIYFPTEIVFIHCATSNTSIPFDSIFIIFFQIVDSLPIGRRNATQQLNLKKLTADFSLVNSNFFLHLILHSVWACTRIHGFNESKF